MRNTHLHTYYECVAHSMGKERDMSENNERLPGEKGEEEEKARSNKGEEEGKKIEIAR